MIYNQDISLDLNTNTSYLVVGAKQGDNIGRTLTATILENGETFNIPSNTSASYRIRKPTGKAIWKTAEVYPHPANKVKITFDTSDLDTSGRNYADILLRQNATRIATVSFIIDIQAAPNIVEGATESEAFNYLYDMVDEAGNIIESAQAWAEGKRGSDEVIGDSYTIAAPSQLNVSLDFDTFKENIEPTTINKVTDYTFIYMNGDWEYNGELVDMNELGFTIIGTPEQNYIITVTASFADPTYHNNAKYYKEEADRLGQSWATGSVNGIPVSSSDPTYKNNSKYYRDVIAASTIDEVITANPGMPAQVFANFDTTDDRFEFDFTLPSIKPHATISVTPLSYTENPTASVQVHDVPGQAASGEAANLQKSFDFAFGIPRGIYTGISNDVTVRTVNTLEPGTNAAARVYATDAEVESEQPREKQFIFEFDLPRGNTGATGAVGQTGPKGDTGAKGDKGDKGDTGATGPQGLKGDTGAVGPQGAAGANGATGQTGPQGAQGETGRGITNVVMNADYTLTFTFSDNTTYTTPSLQGPQGIQGPQGQQGTAAEGTATITIGTVTEAAAGSPPSITNVGTNKAAKLNFVLPTGAAAVNIDDTATSNNTVWSSEKVSTELAPIQTTVPTLQTNVSTLQTEVEAANTGLLARTTTLETNLNSAESNISNAQSAITALNNKVGSGSIGHSLGDNLVSAIDSLWTQTFGVSGLATTITDHTNRIAALEPTTSRLVNEIEDATSGLSPRVATLEATIQTKQANLTFSDSGVGELVIALA